MPTRSVAENIVSLRRFFATDTITREKTFDDLAMMSRWPKVGGSNDPGYTAMVLILPPFPRERSSPSYLRIAGPRSVPTPPERKVPSPGPPPPPPRYPRVRGGRRRRDLPPSAPRSLSRKGGPGTRGRTGSRAFEGNAARP